MMTVEILRKVPTLAVIDDITLDASISETHTFESEVTQYPVESGATISDHVYNKPDKLTINGFVSNSPLSESTEEERAHTAFEKLLTLRDSREPVSIVTGLQNYGNMVMTSLQIPRSIETVESLRFTAEFVAVRIAESQTVPIASLKTSFGINKKAAKKIKTGNQTPELVVEKKIADDAMFFARQSAPASTTSVQLY